MAVIVSSGNIVGTSGADLIIGGGGSDVLDAGAGSDRVLGSFGNDTFIHRIGENVGSVDYYDGGAGSDTLRLVLTQADWMRKDVRDDIAGFQAAAASTSWLLKLLGLSNAYTFKSTNLTATNIETIKVTVAGVAIDLSNRTVAAQADAINTDQDTTASVNLLANDTVAQRAASIKLLSPSTLGTFSLTPSLDGATQTATLTFIPSAALKSLTGSQTATETVQYQVTDVYGNTSIATVTIKVQGKNDAAAIAVDSTVTDDRSVTEAGGATNGTSGDATASGKLKITDIDTGEAKFQTLSTAQLTGKYGSFTFDAATGNWKYTLDQTKADPLAAGVTDYDKLTVTSLDYTATKDIVVTITGANDAPVIVAANTTATGAVTEDNQVTKATGLITASDVDRGATLSYSGSAAGTYGSFAVDATGKWVYTLDNSKAATQALSATDKVTETFTVTVTDDQKATVTQTVTVTVTGTNDAPVVSGAVTGAAIEDGAASKLDALANASDVDRNTTLSVVNVPTTLPAGVTYDAATHSFSLDPSNAAYQALAAQETTTVTVSYGVSDGTATTPATVTWTVTGTNDAPVVSGAVTGAVDARAPLSTLDALANATDVDHTTTLSVVNVPTTLPAGVTYNEATHSFSLDPSNSAYTSLPFGISTKVSVTYGVTDGTATTQATAEWIVTGTNHAPEVVAGAPSSFTGAAGNLNTGAPFSYDLKQLFTDADKDELTIVIDSMPRGFTLENGVLTQTSATNASLGPGDYTFTVLANDGHGGIATKELSLSVALRQTFGDYVGAYSGSYSVTKSTSSLGDKVAFGSYAGYDNGRVTVSTGGGNDTITFANFPGIKNGSVTASGGDGDDTITLAAMPGAYSGKVSIDGDAGNDTISVGHTAGFQNGRVTANGGDGDDTITFGELAGRNGLVSANGDGGNDTITFGDYAGLSGSVSATGGDGDDTITFGNYAADSGNVKVLAGNGSDKIRFGDGIVGSGTLSIDLGVNDQAADQLTFAGPINATVTSFEVGTDRIVFSQYGDTVTLTESNGNAHLVGSVIDVWVNGVGSGHTLADFITYAPVYRGGTATLAVGNLIPAASTDLSFDLKSLFKYTDGGQIKLTASGLPSGFTLGNDGILRVTDQYQTGSAGDMTIKVTADDGYGNTTTTDVKLAVALKNNFGDQFYINQVINTNGSRLDDRIEFGNNWAARGDRDTVNAGDGNDHISFGDWAGWYFGQLTVNAGNGDDKITFARGAADDNGAVTVNAGNGSDTITFGDLAGLRSGVSLKPDYSRTDNGTLSVDLGLNDHAADTVTFLGSAKATIAGFEVGNDKIVLNTSSSTFAATQTGGDLRITGTEIDLTLKNVGAVQDLSTIFEVTKPWIAAIGSPTNTSVTEDSSPVNGQLLAKGVIPVLDLNAGETGFRTAVAAPPWATNWGTLTLATDGSYTYAVNNTDGRVQSLGSSQTHTDAFTVTAIDGTSREVFFTIQGTNDAAVIGSPANAAVTEDANVNGVGQLTATGRLSISDADTGEGVFKTTVAAAQGATNWGTLTLAADGSYTYVVDNTDARVQGLGTNQTHIDRFTVSTADGTTKDVSFTINGVDENRAPVVRADAPSSFTAEVGNNATTVSYDLKTLFSDVDGDTLAISLDSVPSGFALDNGVLTQTSTTDLSSAGRSYTLNVTADDRHGGFATDTITLTVAQNVAYSDNYSWKETTRVAGSSAGDVLTFGSTAAQFGDLTVEGNDGADSISFGNFAAVNRGRLSVSGGNGNDTIKMVGLVAASAGSAYIYGGDGNDTLEFGSYAAYSNGYVEVDAGQNDDRIIFGSTAANDRGTIKVWSGSGADTVEFGYNAGAGSSVNAPGSISIDLGVHDGAADKVTFQGSVLASITSFEVGIDHLSFNGQPVAISADANKHVHFTGAGIDVTLLDVTFNTNMKVSDFLLT